MSLLLRLLVSGFGFTVGTLLHAVPNLPHESSDLAPDPSIAWGTLDNGFRYAISPHAKPVGRASVVLLVEVGAYHETERQSGYAHFVEHMVFNGTTNFPGNKAIRALEDFGLSFGAHANASTGVFETKYRIDDLPLDRPNALDTGLRVLRDFAGEALFEPKEVRNEAKVIVNELRYNAGRTVRFGEGPRSDDEIEEGLLFINERDGLFDETRVESRRPAGRSRSVKRASARSLKDFYDSWYRPERMILAIAGDLEPEVVASKVEALFGDLVARTPAPAEPPAPEFTQLQFEAPRLFVRRTSQRDQAYVCIASAYPSVAGDSKSIRKEAFAMKLALDAIGRRVGSEIRGIQKVNTGIDNSVPGWNLPFVRVACRKSDLHRVALELNELLAEVMENGIGTDHYGSAQYRARKSILQGRSAVNSAESSTVARWIATETSRGWVATGVEESQPRQFNWLEELTHEESLATLRENWVAERTTVLINSSFPAQDLYSSTLAEDLRAGLAEMSTNAMQASSASDQDSAGSEFNPPRRGVVDSSPVVSEQFNETLQSTIVDFENGVRLAVKHLPVVSEEVSVKIHIGFGALATRKRPVSLANSYEFMWMADDRPMGFIEEIFWDGRMRFRADMDHFELSFQANKRALPYVLESFAEGLLQPTYGGRKLARVELENYLAGKRDSLGGMITRKFSYRASGDKFLYRPFEEDLLKDTSDQEMADWLGPLLAFAPMEIAIVGDIESEEAVKALRSNFARLPSRSTTDDLWKLRRFQEPDLPLKVTVDRGRKGRTESALLGWLIRDETGWEDDAYREIISLALDARIMRVVREENGQSYAPGAKVNEMNEIFSSALILYSKSSSRNQRRVLKALRSLVADFLAEGLTDVEFERVKAQAAFDFETSLGSTEFWLELLSSTRLRLEQSEALVKGKSVIDSITKEDVLLYAREHIPLDRSVEVRTRRR